MTSELNRAELRRLAEAAAHKDWYAGNAYGKPFILNSQIITDTPDGKYVLLDGNHHFRDDCVANVAFVGAANPAAVLSLLDQCEGLMAQHARDSATLRELCQARDDAKKERDAALAELEACRKDAERYQWVRDQHDDLSGKCWVATHQKGGWVSLDSAVLGVEREIQLDLDSAVDAAMAEESRK